MTRKHFQAIADGLAASKPNCSDDSLLMTQWENDVLQMANVCQQFNANFNRSRFLEACGYDK